MTFERLDFAGKTTDQDGKGQSTDSEYDKEINGFYSRSYDSSNYYESQDSQDDKHKMTDPKEEPAAKQARPSPQEKRPSLLQELIAASKQNMSVVSGGTDLHSIEEGSALESLPEESVELSIASAPKPPPPPVPRRTSFRQSALNNAAKEISTRYNMLKCDNDRLVQVNLRNFSYYIPMKMDKPTVPTVFNQSVPYAAYEVVRRIHRYVWRDRSSSEPDTPAAAANGHTSDQEWKPTTVEDVVLPFSKRPVLKDVNLVLKPGKTYLVLGPPSCGKTSLLKAIADRLHFKGDSEEDSAPHQPHREGRIEYNGVSTNDANLIVPNLCSFVAQLDEHAPYLTVRETFEFAYQCRTGGKNEVVGQKKESATATTIPEGGAPASTNTDTSPGGLGENLTIKGLDLSVCADTFVGNESVRGVSGGQRRRVTVGEMMQGAAPVACADEISTGLDAQVTYDIIHSIVAFAKAAKTTRIVSLLQPGPETFSLFDEVILLDEGMVIFAGPITEVVDYFADLGYHQPATMDIADFLVSLPTPDGVLFTDHEHYTAAEFHEHFKKSQQMKFIESELNATSVYNWKKVENGKKFDIPEDYVTPYQNSFSRAMNLNFKRFLTLWRRDLGFIIGKMFENIGMAVATGGILFGQARNTSNLDGPPQNEEQAEEYNRLVQAVYGALFMTCLHITLGTMTSAPDEIDGRGIHYKHYDANFYQVFAFVFGRLLSTIPQRSLEIVSFGIPLYWMVGLDPTAGSFFLYLLLLIAYTTGLKMMFSILAQCLPKKANVQSVGTFFVLIFTLFGGFIVFPDSIPGFYSWLYWINPFAWALQGLASIEFTSSKYDDLGIWRNTLLGSRGFQTDRAFIGYSFAYLIPFTLLSTVVLGFVLKKVRIEPTRASSKKIKQVAIGDLPEKDSTEMNLPFTPVDLTFNKLVYEVLASTGGDKIRLLNEISGTFKAGRMCALMGSSGAGKTTLLDVIAMRKTSGDIEGEIRLNGFPQERVSFLRCSGYVEQFDIQQPELTVRETVEFCARLRIDANDPMIKDDEGKRKFAAHVLEIMELTNIQNLQVGSFSEGGLTFEQRKRLSIACELAGSPSVIFLDEPTSGLDSRGAIVVMRAMKRIADTGRTVCATIHQPSSAVFEMFDDLLLLKKGGNVVYFGELGDGSANLIEYFESRGANPIKFGENPAAWMLTCFAGEQAATATRELDWAMVYTNSEQYKDAEEDIAAIQASADPAKQISYDEIFVTTFNERMNLMIQRLYRIYKRSPAYNLARLMIAIFYSFIMGSVFLQSGGRREFWRENEMSAVISTMFLSLIVIGITSISMAVPVTQQIRDVFYKHRASGMLSHTSLSWSLFLAETPYICFISLLFGAVYYGTVGLFHTAEQFGLFWVFFTLNIAIYNYFGQAFICLVKDTPTAGALVGALIGYNIFFSGLVVRPQYFVGPFQLGYWTAPGRFALEGLVITQFAGNELPIVPEYASPYFFYLNCTADIPPDEVAFTPEEELPLDCLGTIDDYVNYFFGGRFNIGNFWIDVGVLIAYMILAKFVTEFALWKFNYVNT